MDEKYPGAGLGGASQSSEKRIKLEIAYRGQRGHRATFCDSFIY